MPAYTRVGRTWPTSLLLTSALRPAPESRLQSSDWSGSGTGSRSEDSRSWTPGRTDRRKPCVDKSWQVWRYWWVGRPPAGRAPRPSSPAAWTVGRTRCPAVPLTASAWKQIETRYSCNMLRPYGNPRAAPMAPQLRKNCPCLRHRWWVRQQHEVHVEDKGTAGSRDAQKHSEGRRAE